MIFRRQMNSFSRGALVKYVDRSTSSSAIGTNYLYRTVCGRELFTECSFFLNLRLLTNSDVEIEDATRKEMVFSL
jgi:hypothetical protein